MSRPGRWVGIGLALIVLLPLVGVAQKPAEGTAKYQIDAVHSSIIFKIRHMNVANFYGRFNEVSGSFTWNDADPAQNKLEAAIAVASVDTANKARNDHLKSKEFFDAEKFPSIDFKTRSFKKTGDGKFEVVGDLTLLGVTKPLTVELQHTGTATDPMGAHRFGLETTFTIKRSEFGLTAAPGALGEDVTLIIALEGVRE